MSSTARMKFEADMQQVHAEYDKTHSKEVRHEASLQRLIKTTKEAGQANSKLTAGTKQALDEAKTAVDRHRESVEQYRKTMAQLRGQLAAGAIDEERYARARAAAASKVAATNPEKIAAAATAAKKAADEQAAATKRQAEAAKAADAAQDEFNRAMQQGASLFEKTRTEAEKYAAELAHLNELKRLGAIDADTHARAKSALDSNSPEAQQRAADAIRAKAEATRQADEAQEAWNNSVREAKSIADAYATAEERHAAEIAKYNRLLKEGALDEKNHARAVAASNERLKEATKDTKALAEAERAENKAKAEAEAITNRNKTAIERHNEALRAAKKAHDNGRISAETYKREVERLNKELNESDSTSKIESTAKALLAGASAAGLLRMGLRAINDELDLQFEKSRKVAGLQRSYAEKSREMRDNFKEDATIGSIEDLDKTVAGISERTGIDPEVVVDAMTAGLGQRGERTNKEVADTVEQAIRYSRTDAGKAVELTQRSLMLSNLTGVSDMKSVMGFMAEASNASAIPSIEKYGATGARAINDAIRRGASPEQAAELFATINKGMGDVEGNRSATATTQLVEQLSSFVPEAGGEDARGKFSIPIDQRAAFEAAKSPLEKLSVMQASPQLRRAFLGKGGASFETAAQATVEGLLSADPKIMALMNEAQGKVPALKAGLGGAFDKEVDRLDSGPLANAAIVQQAGEAGVKRGAMGNIAGGKAGTTAELLFGDSGLYNNPNIDLPGLDSLERWKAKKSYQARIAMGATAEEAGTTTLKNYRESITSLGGGGPDQERLLAALDATLKLIEKNTREGVAEQKKGNVPPVAAPRQPIKPGADPVMGGQPH